MGDLDLSREGLAGLLAGLGSARVLVVGDAMLDVYHDGQLRGAVPAGDAETVSLQRTLKFPGGAANVAMNAAALGASVALVGVTGEDAESDGLRGELRRGGVADDGLVAVAGRPTTLKQRFMAGGRPLLRADREDSSALPDLAIAELCRQIAALGADADAIIVSDYAKGVVTPAVMVAVLTLARSRNVPVLVDPKGTDFSRYRGADYLIPNTAELARAGLAGADLAALRSLLAANDHAGLVVKLGARGARLVTPSLDLTFAVPALPNAETIGAGDSFIAMLALAIVGRRALPEAVQLANLAATVACSTPFTASVGIAALRDLSGPQGEPGWQARVAAWRTIGLRVGFTNGCFDVLHAGHMHLLETARGFCDRLVVGLNTDESVRRLKGPDRPFHTLPDRQRLLRALRPVDLVVPFAEATPMALIEAIRPDVLVKGADYTIETVVGAAFVRAYGGEVRLVDLVPGLSTTAVLGHAARVTR